MNSKTMKWAAACLLIAAAPAAFSADIKAVDSIAAVADGDIITQRQLNVAVARMAADKPQGMTESDFRKQVLAQLINQSLVAQAGKRRHIQAEEGEIDAVVAQTAAARKMTPEQYYAASERSGLSKEALRQSVADSIIANKVQQQVVMQGSQVSEREVDAAIAQAQAANQPLPQGAPVIQYRAQHILIKDNPANRQEAQNNARKIWELARSGQDFDQLARRYSADGSAQAGGDLGWFSDGQMVTSFENAIHQLKPGQISQPVRSQFGWHVIKLNEVRETGTAEERSRNAVRQALQQQKARQATGNLLKELHQSAYIDIR